MEFHQRRPPYIFKEKSMLSRKLPAFFLGPLLIAILNQGCSNPPAPSGLSYTKPQETHPAVIDQISSPKFTPHYSVFVDDDSSMGPSVPRRRVAVRVPANLSREQLEQTLRAAAQEIIDKHHPKGFLLFGYMEGTDTNGEYTAGRVNYGPGGDVGRAEEDASDDAYQMKIDLADFYFERGKSRKPVKTSSALLNKLLNGDPQAKESVDKKLSEAVRRALFYEICQAEDRATKQSESDYPLSDDADQKTYLAVIGKRNQREEDLGIKFRRQVAKKHHISVAEMEEVKSEGLHYHWPTPQL